MPTMTQAGYTPPKPDKKKPDKPPKPHKGGGKKKKGKKAISGAAVVSLLIFFAAMLVGAATIYIYTQTQPYVNAYLVGTSLDGYPLGGATQEDAHVLLDRMTEQEVAAWQLTMTYMGQTYTLTAEDVGLSIDREATLDPIWQLGRSGHMLSRYVQMLRLRRNPVNAEPVIVYDMAAVDALLERVAADIEREACDAAVTFRPGTSTPFAYTDEVTGLALHTQPLRAQIEQAIANLEPVNMVLVPEEIAPEVLRSELESAVELRCRLVTAIAADDASYANVSLAAAALHGAVIAPGEAFSFNETVGKRTAEAGYQAAAEPAYGEDVSGVGGGVCQASTALYRAALLAGLTVTQRSAAARPVDYCEIGQEAAVSDQGLDLVIENPTDCPLYMTARTYKDDGAAYLEIVLIGKPLDVRYEIVSESTQTPLIEEPVYVRDREGKYARYTDERVDVGEALPGYEAVLTRMTLDESGKEIAQEEISRDSYEAVPPTIYVGIEEREQ